MPCLILDPPLRAVPVAPNIEPIKANFIRMSNINFRISQFYFKFLSNYDSGRLSRTCNFQNWNQTGPYPLTMTAGAKPFVPMAFGDVE